MGSSHLHPPLPAAPRILILGSDGLVGSTLAEQLRLGVFPAAEVTGLPFLSLGREAASAVAALQDVTSQVDLAFLALGAIQSRAVAPILLAQGAWVLDFSDAFRLDPTTPLAVAGMGQPFAEAPHGLLAMPNCTNPALFPVLQALHLAGEGLQRVRVHTVQAASGGGRRLLASLETDAATGEWKSSLRGDVWPQIGALDSHGRSAEEAAIVEEARRALGLVDLDIAASCLRVPVASGHGMTVEVQTTAPLCVQQACEALEGLAELQLSFDEEAPTPRSLQDRDLAQLGRMRLVHANRPEAGLMFWLVADNLRHSAASHALRVAKDLLPGAAPSA